MKVVARVENKIRFWEHRWWGRFHFSGPSLLQISTAHNQTISHFLRSDSSSNLSTISWNLHFRRNLKDEEVNDLSLLLGSLDPVILIEGAEGSGFGIFQGYFPLDHSSSLFSLNSFPYFPLSLNHLESAYCIQDSSVLVVCSVW